ncbi:hypothetical protein GGTG_01010 [Gaeumannomyces tritici R3-111a-1]|uniref:DUF4211 domain-containing protein n=1 Tax=Gaeumannomyces tritici (strain R3-111a-1) TaxID=644352 RepID=J3NIC8_GAET3|nr:hypothetical protein GGTG_01010 [Gaeumannomyces tritici R3-111a-1]EJT81021.1 hypothetical protein GGTG_01010 [Gaeumannomyces tritici R3-111a-1]
MDEDQETATENPVGERQSGDDPISPCRDEARDSSEEGEVLVKRTPRPRSRHSRNLIASSEGDNDDSEQDVAPIKRTPRPRNRRRYEHTASDEDGSDDVGIHSSSTKRRRLIHKGAPGAEETLEHGVEGTPGPSCEVRGSQGRRSRRNKHLELLRRRRQGEGDSKADETSSSSGEDRVGLYDTDPENPALDEFDDEESDDQLRTGRSEENKDDDSRIDKAKNTDMDDFIDDSVGMNDASASLENVGFEIPLEFTAQARKPMSAYFQDAIEWLIQFHISPSFKKNRPTYLMAWRKLGDEVLALAVSRFSSSVWTAEFYRTLRARPYIDEHTPERYPTLAEDLDDCQACNRTNHPATSHIRFTGAPYDPDSLEELSNDSSSDGDGDSDEDDGDRDQHGHIIAAEGREWLVGSVCASNAQTAHDLYHWKHSLKDCVRDLLAQRGFLRQEKLAEREHLSVEECREICVGINNDWVSTGVVERLYQEFTNMLEEALIKRTTRSRRAGR